ncbi:MAG: Tol-Pal system protein TolB [Sulfurovaceae bacterium]|nr:Tol-Pal system protein TolB [Sulfurovaceae bacterium]
MMRFIFSIIMLLTVLMGDSDAELTIKKKVDNRSKIAIADGSTSIDNSTSRKVFSLFLNDLKLSGNFSADSRYYTAEYSSDVLPTEVKSNEYTLKYQLLNTSGASLSVILIQNSNGTKLFQKSYSIGAFNKYPFLVHKAVSDINRILGYGSIDWMNRLVLFTRYTASRQSEIILSDYTFTYKYPIIRSGLNLFPKWSDKSQSSFYYTAMNGARPVLYRYHLNNGTKDMITSSDGMLVCSDVSSNGSKLLLTMAPNGQPDIYEYDVATKSASRLTDFGGIDVSGQYMSGEKQIVFVSNRLGYPNIFKKYLTSPSVSPVVSRGRNNNSCDAFGNKIVYSSRESSERFRGNTFNIYLNSTSGTTPLTNSGDNQFPRFSSDGNVVLYVKQQSGKSLVGYVNIDTKESSIFNVGSKVQSIDW